MSLNSNLCVFYSDGVLTYDTKRSLSPLGKSDHSIITFDFMIHCKKIVLKGKKFYYDKANFTSIRAQLDSLDWIEILKNKTTQEQWDTFDIIIKGCEEMYVPHSIIEVNRDTIISIRNYFH